MAEFTIAQRLMKRNTKLSVVGLGYVGLPLAVAFARKGVSVIGYDRNEAKIAQYQQGIDATRSLGDAEVASAGVSFTADEACLRDALFHVIAVPTPVHQDHTPDLSAVFHASQTVGRYLCKGAYVVYESTVYPGVTEDLCVPILEKASGLKCGVDFKVGYSPERINPGDQCHTLESVVKIVSGMDAASAHEIEQVYQLVVEAGTYLASSIKTAEAIKVAENSQRDINIAFMNELAVVFGRMGIDTGEVVDGMNTKWNALGFRSGLVGGHCISVDPYYFIYEAEKLGYHSQVIAAGRSVNDSMGRYVADEAIQQLVKADCQPRQSRIVILGLTFKENCADLRNSRVFDIVARLREFGVNPLIADPLADVNKARTLYDVDLVPLETICDVDCVIAAVAHDAYRALGADGVSKLFGRRDKERILLDVKGIFPPEEIKKRGITLWRL